MEITEKQQQWRKGKQLTSEKMALARIILDEIRNGRVVLDALRAHPMAAGGVVEKPALVAVYNELVAAGAEPFAGAPEL